MMTVGRWASILVSLSIFASTEPSSEPSSWPLRVSPLEELRWERAECDPTLRGPVGCGGAAQVAACMAGCGGAAERAACRDSTGDADRAAGRRMQELLARVHARARGAGGFVAETRFGMPQRALRGGALVRREESLAPAVLLEAVQARRVICFLTRPSIHRISRSCAGASCTCNCFTHTRIALRGQSV